MPILLHGTLGTNPVELGDTELKVVPGLGPTTVQKGPEVVTVVTDLEFAEITSKSQALEAAKPPGKPFLG